MLPLLLNMVSSPLQTKAVEAFLALKDLQQFVLELLHPWVYCLVSAVTTRIRALCCCPVAAVGWWGQPGHLSCVREWDLQAVMDFTG